MFFIKLINAWVNRKRASSSFFKKFKTYRRFSSYAIDPNILKINERILRKSRYIS